MSEETNQKRPEEMGQFFDVRCSGYDEHMRNTVKSFEEFYNLIASPIEETHQKVQILDLGCGTGLEVAGILRKAPNCFITAVDLSEKMLGELARKYEGHLHQIQLVRDSYLSLEFPRNTYDYAASVMSMHHLLHEVKRSVYERIRKSLKPGGKYVEGDYTVSEEKEKEFLKEYFEKRKLVNDDRLYHIDIPFSVETQKQLMLEAGFDLVEVIWQAGEAAILVASTAWRGE